MKLSWAQAVEVAKRMNPRAGQVLFFGGDGSLLHSWPAQIGVSRAWGEVYACRRDESARVVVARVPHDHVDRRLAPAYGTSW